MSQVLVFLPYSRMLDDKSKSGTTSTYIEGIVNEFPNTLITTVHLDGINFLALSQSTKLFITGKGKSRYLTGDTKMPNTKDPTYQKWEAENTMVMSNSYIPCSLNIANNYLFLTTAKAIWDSIAKTYSKSGNKVRLYDLHKKVSQLRHGNQPLTVYYSTLHNFWEEIDF